MASKRTPIKSNGKVNPALRVQQWREQNRDHVNAQAADRRDALAAQGLCIQCRRKNRDLSRRRCPTCAKAARLAEKASREAKRAT